MTRPRKGGVLSDEDRELWNRVAASIAPLDERKPAEASIDPSGEIGPTLESSSAPRPQRRTPNGRTPAASPPPPAKPAHRPMTRSLLPSLERRRQRQIASGRVEIDARLDLHGMTQEQAHRTLRAFLYACSARGDRIVLVITGKGSPTRSDDDFHWDAGASRDRGVLRRNVPRWLAEPDLVPLVVGFAVAGIRHGGEGALYLQIRSRLGD